MGYKAGNFLITTANELLVSVSMKPRGAIYKYKHTIILLDSLKENKNEY